jgi:hypothetical protein
VPGTAEGIPKFPAQAFSAGETARRHHVDTLLALLGANVKDEPQVVGEQGLLARDQAANESGYVGRQSKSSLQLWWSSRTRH